MSSIYLFMTTDSCFGHVPMGLPSHHELSERFSQLYIVCAVCGLTDSTTHWRGQPLCFLFKVSMYRFLPDFVLSIAVIVFLSHIQYIYPFQDTVFRCESKIIIIMCHRKGICRFQYLGNWHFRNTWKVQTCIPEMNPIPWNVSEDVVVLDQAPCLYACKFISTGMFKLYVLRRLP